MANNLSSPSYKTFPSTPGVYLFKNSEKLILYIGKAISLKNRVASYFRKQLTDWKVNALIAEHATIEYISTPTEIEASLLEAELIKQHQPKYNVLLKSGQPFLYIYFTKKPYPTIKIVRTKKQKGVYFGPFLQKKEARSTYNFLVETFKLKICNKKIAHGCLDYHIGLCPGSCMADFSQQDYLFRLNLAQQVLKNKHKAFITDINHKIEEYNASLAFEKAAHMYIYLNNIETIFNTIKIDYKISNFINSDNASNTITQKPEIPDIEMATIETANSNTPAHNPKPDYIAKNKKKALEDLQQLLDIPTPISTIDCFDISHFQSKSIVGSAIRFTNGSPEKNKFRRFNVVSITQQNDYAALQEIVSRRYKNGDFPDVILIDGGKGQLSSVQKIVPGHICISLAKKNELLFSDLHPQGVPLDIHTPMGKLLIELRDYAHHFAITHHRNKKKKADLK